MTNKLLWWGLGGVAAWWLADHVAIDQGGTGFSFPFRTEDDRKKLEEQKARASLPPFQLPVIPGPR